MPRHRIFKSQLKKKLSFFPAKKNDFCVRNITLDSGLRFGDIPFSEDVPTVKTLSGEFERIDKEFDDVNKRIDQSMVGLYRYCGTVQTYEDLPFPDLHNLSESLKAGDTYDVVSGYGDIPPGTNWSWTGEKWDPLAGSMADYLSKQAASGIYATKNELSTGLSYKIDRVLSSANNIAIFNIDGNLDDSGKTISYFATSAQGEKADTAYQLPSDGIPTSHIKDKAITTDKINTGAVTGNKNDVVTVAGKIALNTIGTPNLRNYAVTTDKIANETINDDKLSPGCVTNAKIRIGAVTKDKLSEFSLWNILNAQLTDLQKSAFLAENSAAKDNGYAVTISDSLKLRVGNYHVANVTLSDDRLTAKYSALESDPSQTAESIWGPEGTAVAIREKTLPDHTSDLINDGADGEHPFITDEVSLEWSALKLLRDAGTLVPGQQYRITDYVATVAYDESEGDALPAKSAHHPFDLIVTADTASSLNEHARAARHVGDGYFPASVKFEAWDVWYCLENARDKYNWAEAEHGTGRGVIYRLIDEFGNDCPYDFKGIVFHRYRFTNLVSDFIGESTMEDVSSEVLGYYGYEPSDFVVATDTGVELVKIEVSDPNDMAERYTFDTGDGTDASLGVEGYEVFSNKIEPAYEYDLTTYMFFLNNIVCVKCIACFNNVFGANCQGMTFTGEFFDNVVHSGVSAIVGFSSVVYSEIGTQSSNMFLYYATYCSFGGSCYSNAALNLSVSDWGDFSHGNMICDVSEDITFGTHTSGNVLRGGTRNIVFGTYCMDNEVGADCISIMLNRACSGNKIGENSFSITFGCGCEGNKIGSDCSNVEFGVGCLNNTFSAGGGASQKGFYHNIVFEPGVSDVNLNCTSNALSMNSLYQNVTIAAGVSNKTISDSNVDQSYKTTYEAHGSQTIDVSTL